MTPAPVVVALIPTRDRRERLATAVSSVYSQTFRPHLLIVVGQTDSDLELLRQREPSAAHNTPIELLINRRASNLSGSVNTAISYILERDFNPEQTYVALLDDDDSWEPDYLLECLSLARGQDLDWVVAGIARHETEGGAAIDLSIPEQLTMSQFLPTNPHIQGSNLFVTLSTLLRAGCFDENLESTTDRDLCARMLALGNVRVGFVPKHLVHHMAFGLDRLSTPGSLPKRFGLAAFYRKYGPLMTAVERESFVRRATSVFQSRPSDFKRSGGAS